MECDRRGCDRAGVWRPSLMCMDPEDGSVLACVELSIQLCSACRLELTAEKMISEDGWAKLEAAFNELGLVLDRRNIQLSYEGVN